MAAAFWGWALEAFVAVFVEFLRADSPTALVPPDVFVSVMFVPEAAAFVDKFATRLLPGVFVCDETISVDGTLLFNAAFVVTATGALVSAAIVALSLVEECPTTFVTATTLDVTGTLVTASLFVESNVAAIGAAFVPLVCAFLCGVAFVSTATMAPFVFAPVTIASAPGFIEGGLLATTGGAFVSAGSVGTSGTVTCASGFAFLPPARPRGRCR